MTPTDSFAELRQSVSQCRLCAADMGHEPWPVVQISTKARLLIAGQAPGAKVHETGVPFDDPSGERLRDWMGIEAATFYSERVAILPMGFCYPGRGASGDLPPMTRCAETWRAKLLTAMPAIQLTLVIGQYAQAWHLDKTPQTLTETVRNWRVYGEALLPLPHPSPRNNIWLKKNPWFEADVLPALRARVAKALA